MWGAVFWAVFGILAANLFSKMPGGAREGAGAMGGFFVVGPACGFVGLILGGWGTWVLLAKPERMGAVSLGLAAVFAVLVAGVMFALRPITVLPDDYPGQEAAFLVEVSFPAAEIERLGRAEQLEFQMRSADGTEVAPWQRSAIRQEAGRAIVPGSFSIRARPRSKLLAVMKGEQQLACSTLTVEGETGASTEWSAWQELEAGLQARWRLAVHPK